VLPEEFCPHATGRERSERFLHYGRRSRQCDPRGRGAHFYPIGPWRQEPSRLERAEQGAQRRRHLSHLLLLGVR
jgi:hypothetical protein